MMGDLANYIPSLRLGPEAAWWFYDMLILFGALGLLTVGLILSVKYGRREKPKRRHKSKSSSTSDSLRVMEVEDRGRHRRRRKYRKRRHDHRPRNPTRAETGGLPPIQDTTASSDQTSSSSRSSL